MPPAQMAGAAADGPLHVMSIMDANVTGAVP